MTTRYNLSQKAHRLRKQFVELNAKIGEASKEKMTPAKQRVITIALRNLRRTYDDLRKVEAQLKELP